MEAVPKKRQRSRRKRSSHSLKNEGFSNDLHSSKKISKASATVPKTVHVSPGDSSHLSTGTSALVESGASGKCIADNEGSRDTKGDVPQVGASLEGHDNNSETVVLQESDLSEESGGNGRSAVATDGGMTAGSGHCQNEGDSFTERAILMDGDISTREYI